MSPTANYRCDDCGNIREYTLPQDEVIDIPCCVPEPDRDRHELSRYRRVWSVGGIGAVPGAGGSPSR